MTIGFIGIGKMGLPITRLLIAAGHPVRAFDADPARLAMAIEAGATAASSVAECAAACTVCFTSLPHDQALRGVVLGEAGVLANLGPGGILVDTSTVSVAVSTEVAEAARVRDRAYVRMPVSGNAHSAASGQLTALVSGPPQAWARVEPVVKAFTVARVVFGEAEQARVMKLAINLMVAGNAMLMAEALALGRAGGVQWETLLDGLAASTLGSPWLRAKTQALKVRDFTPTFTPDQLAKDLSLMIEAGDQQGVPLPMTAYARQMMKAVSALGWADEDFIAIVKLVEQQSGLSTETP
jgi:3-hydroxyisobutyrate dehydrogenase-like beta-hydroxyacid dehydrogenase